MARTRRLHRSGSSGLRSPILRRHPNLKAPPLAAGRDTTALGAFCTACGRKRRWTCSSKSKAPEKDRNAAANTAEVIERMVQQQHLVVEQVAASPPVPALRADEIKEVEMLNSTKSGVPEKDKNATANAAEVMGGRCSRMTRSGRGQSRQKRERLLASAPTCRSSATSNAKVQRRSSAESKASCAPRISRSAMAHRSRATSLRRPLQSAAASRAAYVPTASSCRMVVRSRVT